jgi:hypothetical protein
LREPRGGRIAVGYGKDAADVAVFTQFGPALFPASMTVGVKRLNRPPGQAGTGLRADFP